MGLEKSESEKYESRHARICYQETSVKDFSIINVLDFLDVRMIVGGGFIGALGGQAGYTPWAMAGVAATWILICLTITVGTAYLKYYKSV